MTPSTPRVSVILATCNQASHLPLLLSSLEGQDCTVPFEVIVCDDGSTDESARQLHHRSWRLDLRHIWQPNDGFRVARSRNNGIRCAQGEILVFVDGDCVLRPSFLRDHLEAHRVPGRLVCGCYQNVVVAEREINADAVSFLATQPAPDGGRDYRDRLRWMDTESPWMACTSGNMSVERSRVVHFDERFCGWGSEDRDFAYRAFASGLEIVLLERAGLVHVWHQNHAVGWNPGKGGDTDAVVAALTSKLLLARKYPGDLMTPSLDLVRYCRYDAAADTWRLDHTPREMSISTVLSEFESWLSSRGRAISSAGCST